MNNEHEADWDPTSEKARQDQEAAYDEMRRSCPVAHSQFLGWSLFRHADVLRTLLDPATFSNAVSQHLSVPNGMDPPEHTAYRQIIEPYFSEARMRAFEPACRRVASELVRPLTEKRLVEFMAEVALPFAVGVQCSFLGWPESLQSVLVQWVGRNQKATLAQDRPALSRLANEFESIIDELLETRRESNTTAGSDLTAALMREKVWGRPLSNEEVASILRNWTAGEIGTISAAAGILVQYLGEHPALQKELRGKVEALPYAIDEILRIHGPLVTNRRVAKKDIEISGKTIRAGERISVNWVSANRDEAVFDAATEFRLDRDPQQNLLYGAGIHVCPGAPLARLELRVFMEELFHATAGWMNAEPAARAVYPASGFASLPIRFH